MTTPHASVYPDSAPALQFAAVPVADLLAGEAELIGRIKLSYGADRATFERDVLTLVQRYAAYVHLLPATAGNYFSRPGGLLRLGLETAFFSLQGTDAHIFSGRLSISARHELEPRWRHATFIAGLCCELHRLLSHVVVSDADGNPWPAFLLPLADWLQARAATHYTLRWKPLASETRSLTVFALPHVVPGASLQTLAEGNSVIVPHLLASLSGVPLYRDHNVLDQLVRRSLALVIGRELASHADRQGEPQHGAHLQRYLVDAMQHLASTSPAWLPNREKSRVWFGQDGLFLVWPGAGEDILHRLEAEQLLGMPREAATLLDLLQADDVLEAAPHGQPTWTIQPPGSRTAVAAVKLVFPALLLAGIDPAPQRLAQALACLAAACDAEAMPGPIEPKQPLGTHDTDGRQSALAQPGDPPVDHPAPAPTILLHAPLRLQPAVRAALAAAVRDLAAADSAVCRLPAGLFVPLAEFERRGVQPSLALRALAEVGLLVRAERDSGPTTTHVIDGRPTLGVLLAPGCLRDDPAPTS